MQSTTDNKKVKKIFRTKKVSITCSNLMSNELADHPARLENVYFANNEQASIAVFTAMFCFTQAGHPSIKL